MGELLVRSMVLQGFNETCKQLSFDPGKLLEKLGIEQAIFNEFNTKVPLATVTALLDEASVLTGRKDFGLLMGSHWTLEMSGPLSMVVLACKTFEDLINKLMTYANAVNLGFRYRLSKQSNFVSAIFSINAANQYQNIQTIELFISRYVKVSKQCIGSNWEPTAILFQHQPFSTRQTYHSIFGQHPTFESEWNGMVFHERDLSLRTDIDNDFMHSKVDEYMTELVAQPDIPFTEKLKLAITDFYGKQEVPELQKLCNLFSISTRTMQHRLSESGTTYRQILNNVQANIAIILISQQRLEISAVSDLLGFSEVSAFSRAFKKWHGHPPSNYLKILA